MAAALLGLAVVAGPHDAAAQGYGGCAAYGGATGTSINQLDKSDGTFLRSFASCSYVPGGLSDDPTSFASSYVELLWTKNASANQLEAVEIPGGTILQISGHPEPFPGVGPPGVATSCPTGTAASDGDGLLDCWKNNTLWTDGRPGISYHGIYNGVLANRDVVLCRDPSAAFSTADCAVRGRKDLFVEIDYMPPHFLGSGVASNNNDSTTAVSDLVQTFTNAPAAPNGPGPIALHVQIGDAIPHSPTIAFVPCTVPAPAGGADFDALKAQWFGTPAERGTANGQNAKALAVRYGIIAHGLPPSGNSSTGCSDIGGANFVVTLASFPPSDTTGGHVGGVGTLDNKEGTLGHELGHTLIYRHGGIDSINCKPNYPSIMNYVLQFSSTVPGRPLDYSRVQLGVPVTLPDGTSSIGLDEAHLDESKGVGPGFQGHKIAFGPVRTAPHTFTIGGGGGGVPAGTDGVDWNQNQRIDPGTVSVDIDGVVGAGCPSAPSAVLEGFNDWAAVQLNFRALDFGAGAHVGFEGSGSIEVDVTQVLALSRDQIQINPDRIDRSRDVEATVTIFGRTDGNGATELDPSHIDLASITLTGPLRGPGRDPWTVHVERENGKFQCKVQDVNRDGIPDLVCKVEFPAHLLRHTGTEVAQLNAVIPGAPGHPPVQYIHASDTIRVVSSPGDEGGGDEGD